LQKFSGATSISSDSLNGIPPKSQTNKEGDILNSGITILEEGWSKFSKAAKTAAKKLGQSGRELSTKVKKSDVTSKISEVGGKGLTILSTYFTKAKESITSMTSGSESIPGENTKGPIANGGSPTEYQRDEEDSSSGYGSYGASGNSPREQYQRQDNPPHAKKKRETKDRAAPQASSPENEWDQYEKFLDTGDKDGEEEQSPPQEEEGEGERNNHHKKHKRKKGSSGASKNGHKPSSPSNNDTDGWDVEDNEDDSWDNWGSNNNNHSKSHKQSEKKEEPKQHDSGGWDGWEDEYPDVVSSPSTLKKISTKNE